MQNTILTELQYVQQMINPQKARHERDNKFHARCLPDINPMQGVCLTNLVEFESTYVNPCLRLGFT